MRSFFLPLTLIIAAAPGVAHAQLEVPKFKKGGFLIEVQAGVGVPHLDQAQLDQQTNVASLLYNQVQTVGMTGFRLGYNILGHASIAIDFTATGWNVFNASRGGSGYLVGLVAWHPLELFFLKKEERPFGLDFRTYVGLGYGIVGTAGPPALGMDGLVVQWGFNIDYFFTRFFGLQFFTKCNFLRWDKFYYDWDGAHANPPAAGSSTTITAGSAGTWWAVGGAIVLRIGD